jgi:hypothetical protein
MSLTTSTTRDAVKADLPPDGVDYAVFDGGVNSGPGRSITWLQQALRLVYTGRLMMSWAWAPSWRSEGDQQQRRADRPYL